MPQITVYTTTYDPERIVDGELGPDARTFDLQLEWEPEDDDPAAWAAGKLEDEGITSPSGGPGFDERIWYSHPDDPPSGWDGEYTGRREQISAHLNGFTRDQLYGVWARLTRRGVLS